MVGKGIGNATGSREGIDAGLRDTLLKVGDKVVASKVGIDEGLFVGKTVDMLRMGLILGDIVGTAIGAIEGKCVGSKDGLADGLVEGDIVVE